MMVTDFHPVRGRPECRTGLLRALRVHDDLRRSGIPGFLAVGAGNATIGLSHRDNLPVDDGVRGMRWQFIVDDVADVLSVCAVNNVPCEVTVEEGGTTYRTPIAKVTSPNGISLWFEGPNEAAS